MGHAGGPAPAVKAGPAAAIGRRVRPVAVIATLVVLVGAASAYAAVGATRSKRPVPRPATTSLTSSTTLDQDLSGKLPVVNVNEAPGDYLGEGHDQVASVQNGALNIYESAKYGGGSQPPTPTDLRATPNDGFTYYPSPGNPESLTWPVWQENGYKTVAQNYALTSVKIASSASNIYMAGATWDDNAPTDPDLNGYQVHLYKLRHDGKCASAGCADKTLDLPSRWVCNCGLFGWPDRVIVATSLTVGVVGGRTLIAVGLSDYGVFIYDENLNLVDQITDMAVPQGEPGNPHGQGAQTPPISLGFGPPSGPGQGGLLAAGVVSPWMTLYSWRLNPDGTEKSMSRAGGFGGVDANVATSAAVGR